MNHEIKDKWLNEKVAPTYDAMAADASRAIAAEDVFVALRRHHDLRSKE